MIWRHDMPPGIYDNLTLRYFLNNGAIDETWDVMDYVEPLEVLPARP